MTRDAVGMPLTLDTYAVAHPERLHTPALAIYPAHVDANISAALRILGGRPDRWRPHLKTAKLAWTMRRYVAHGVRQAKCATTLELDAACHAGFDDVLLAYAAVGERARRTIALARENPHVRVSALIESPELLPVWTGSPVGLFIDVNPGMDRTGVPLDCRDSLVALARSIVRAGLVFRGLHVYDGHVSSVDPGDAAALVHVLYDRVVALVAELRRAGIDVPEVITAGTPALPHALTHGGLREAGTCHRVSPGTLVYCDTTSLPAFASAGFRPAALVVTTVVSRPTERRVTCDAGHKAVSADAGVPTCAVVGRSDLVPAAPSEEHLPLDVADPAECPQVGEFLYLVPRHVCPTVNNFDTALLVSDGDIVGVEVVSARGRDAPLSPLP